MSIIYIKELDDILETLRQQGTTNVWNVKPEQANATMLAAYRDSKEQGKSRLDFNNGINDTDVQPIAHTCRRLGITEFTITVMQGSLVHEILFRSLVSGVMEQRRLRCRYTATEQ